MILYTSILTVDSADFKTGTENKLEQVQKLASSSCSVEVLKGRLCCQYDQRSVVI